MACCSRSWPEHPVGQAGEGVVEGEEVDLLARVLLGRDVQVDAVQARGAALLAIALELRPTRSTAPSACCRPGGRCGACGR
jgi:hypothetical protein